MNTPYTGRVVGCVNNGITRPSVRCTSAVPVVNAPFSTHALFGQAQTNLDLRASDSSEESPAVVSDLHSSTPS